METIGCYELIEKIGSGGMGVVYRTLDTNLDREVALKLMSPHLQVQQTLVNRFLHEAQIVAQLEHAHIVPIYDVGMYENRPFLVMRLLRGGTLQERINAGLLDQRQLWEIMAQVALALDAAHAQNVIHRDVKPTNILFNEQGAPFVSDFGIAKVIDATTQLTGDRLIGTPAYMSPEQFTGQAVDGRSDQYSLAVVIFEALTGIPLFSGDTLQIMYKHVHVEALAIHLVNPDLSPDLSPALAKALAKNPAERYATVTEFVAALQASAALPDEEALPVSQVIVEDTPPEALPTSPSQTATPPAAQAPASAHASSAVQTVPSATAAAPIMGRIVAGAGGPVNKRGFFPRFKRPILLGILLLLFIPLISALLFWPGAQVDNDFQNDPSTRIPLEPLTLIFSYAAQDAAWQMNDLISPLPEDGALQLLQTGDIGVLTSGSGIMALTLPDGVELFLNRNSTVELQRIEGNEEARDLIITLREGVVVANVTGAPFTIYNPFGATAHISNGLLGVIHSRQPFRFEVDCLQGVCRIAGDLDGELNLQAGQYSFVGGAGNPAEPAPARYELYSALSAYVPTPTVTPSSTSTAEPTNSPTPTRTGTATLTTTATATKTPTSTLRPTNTTAPIRLTNTPTPFRPTNTPLPSPPTQPPPTTAPPTTAPPTTAPPTTAPPTIAPPTTAPPTTAPPSATDTPPPPPPP